MKKTVFCIVAAGIACAATLSGVGCGEKSSPEMISVYAPDGAPALALANVIKEQGDNGNFSFHIVDSKIIAQQVSGTHPASDVCILPVNVAAKVLGDGQTYQMLGTVTNGNMYFLSKGTETVLTLENLKTALMGKTVGVVQLTNVPGLTLQSVLRANHADYQILTNSTAAAVDKINLKPIQDPAAEVVPVGDCDYFLCPEPLASAKVAATEGKPVSLKMSGSLQELYGGQDGYPQAVVVVKKSVIENGKQNVEQLMQAFAESSEFLDKTPPEEVLSLLADKYTAGMTPSLNAKNLTAEVIKNCSVKFTSSADCKDRTLEFLSRLHEIDGNVVSTVADEFFYLG